MKYIIKWLGEGKKPIISLFLEDLMVLIDQTLSPLHPRMIFAKFSWKLPSGSEEEDF